MLIRLKPSKGVLRGDRARFQLFGDAMNVTARMESSSHPGRIQLSREAADVLYSAGKQHWLEPRESTVDAKGKGNLQTYWLRTTNDGYEDTERSEDPLYVPTPKARIVSVANTSSKDGNLIEWNVEMLLGLIKGIVAFRNKLNIKKDARNEKVISQYFGLQENGTFLDEVKEVIHLPQNIETSDIDAGDLSQIEIPKVVVKELRELIKTIAAGYKPNPFHSFEVCSLLSSVVLFSDKN